MPCGSEPALPWPVLFLVLTCVLAVLTALGEQYGIDRDTAVRFGAGYGGGMGCLGSTCGDLSIREIASWKLDRIVAEIREHAESTAAVVVEPLMTRFGLIPLEGETVTAIADACRDLVGKLAADRVRNALPDYPEGVAAWWEKLWTI